MCEALTFLTDNIYIRFGSKFYQQSVGIPMGTNCSPLVADLFLFCYDRDFMLSLSDDNQYVVIEAFTSTSRYLDGFVKTKIFDKQDIFVFYIVNFPCVEGVLPRSTSYGVCISQLIRFARVSSHVDEPYTRNKVLTTKLLRH